MAESLRLEDTSVTLTRYITENGEVGIEIFQTEPMHPDTLIGMLMMGAFRVYMEAFNRGTFE